MSGSMHEQHAVKSALYAAGAALAFACTGTVVQIIGERASTDTVVFFRYLIGLGALLPWVLKDPKGMLRVAQPVRVIGRSVMTLLSVGSLIYALRLIPLGNALTLNSTYALFIPIVLWVMHKIKTPHKMWIGISLGFVGTVIVVQPDPASFHIGSLFALGSGCLAAVTLVMIRFLTKSMGMTQILLYNFLVGSVITACLLPLDWIPVDGETVVLLCGVGAFSAAYQVLLTHALAKGSVRVTSPLLYLSIVFGVISDYFLWHLIPSGWALFGMACVIVGGLLTVYFGKKEA